jgi:hypothetical protein
MWENYGFRFINPVDIFTQEWQLLYASSVETDDCSVFCLAPSVHYFPGLMWGTSSTDLWKRLQKFRNVACSRCVFGFMVAMWYDSENVPLEEGTLACVFPPV